ncbi:hypothetical protein T01_1859 [Trichinella spiralis]|uniref:Uncharacterized protein n=1 Tax=Trichinella spiralis TaxID=6334 RepID=A0A0V1ANN6_TRISP|nr:hypothetical protein T01_1859 [Trichinella spiralis]
MSLGVDEASRNPQGVDEVSRVVVYKAPAQNAGKAFVAMVPEHQMCF